jgi:hypothetical protein
MDSSLFLVARVTIGSLGELAWMTTDGDPYSPHDMLDFSVGADIGRVFELYRSTYLPIDQSLNVLSAVGLLEYNRWILITDDSGAIVAFALLKVTRSGLKFGLAGHDDSMRAKLAVVTLHRNALRLEGVFAEVSPPIERALIGHVPEVPADSARSVLDKSVTPDADGVHYFRQIVNVGRRKKLLVGRPLVLPAPSAPAKKPR